MCLEKKYYSQYGMGIVAVPNPNLDGTGTLTPIFTSNQALAGTTLKSITIKALGNTSEGMVRLFIDNGSVISLYREFAIPASVQNQVYKSYEVHVEDNLILNPTDTIFASTAVADSFNVIVEAYNWDQCNCESSEQCPSEQHFPNTGIAQIAVPNAALNGSGPMMTFLTALPVTAQNAGTILGTINIKAITNTSQGMVRFFINDGVNNYLYTEVPIPASVATNIEPSYRTEYFCGMMLPPGYSIRATTQNADTFNIIVDGMDVTYCSCH